MNKKEKVISVVIVFLLIVFSYAFVPECFPFSSRAAEKKAEEEAEVFIAQLENEKKEQIERELRLTSEQREKRKQEEQIKKLTLFLAEQAKAISEVAELTTELDYLNSRQKDLSESDKLRMIYLEDTILYLTERYELNGPVGDHEKLLNIIETLYASVLRR